MKPARFISSSKRVLRRRSGVRRSMRSTQRQRIMAWTGASRAACRAALSPRPSEKIAKLFPLTEKLLAEVTPCLVNSRIAAPLHRLRCQRRERLDRIGSSEPPELDHGGKGCEMQPFMK